ncbi:MAG TPA: hypothetical protein VK278_03760 [Gaiellaceae bacterium]|nr:hypothetical protein [Gaiellaceae bacterium]
MGRGDQPAWNVAQRFRLRPDEVEEVRAEIHGHLRRNGRAACSWEVGSSATPSDLVDRLHALGLVDDEPDPLAIGMVLTNEPEEPPPAGVEVRRARTREELLEAGRIAAVAFGMPGAVPEPEEPTPGLETYVAYVDGRPAARATAAFTQYGATLFGGATLPEARGRGAYRALVAARWEDAVARGTPMLVTQAGRMSRPILERLGFRAVCEIRILVDRVENRGR